MKESNISEFLKVAKEKGKIRNIKEAYKEYPVEEEWHKGKIQSLVQLREKSIEYNLYSIGDIVFVSEYRYDDGSKGKNHLFVIIEQNNLVVPIENFGMLISSNISKIKYKTNKALQKDEINGLHKDSIVKTDVIYKIANEQILFKIGKVDSEKIEQYKQSFYKQLSEEE